MTTLITLANTPMLPGGDVLSSALTPSRFLEIWFVCGACVVGIYSTVREKVPKLPTRALYLPALCWAFCLWALFTALWSEMILTGVGKALELLILVLAAYYAVLHARSHNPDNREIVANSLSVGVCAAILILLAANIGLHGTPIPFTGADLFDPFAGHLRSRFYLGWSHPLTTGTLLALAIVLVANSNFRMSLRLSAILGLGVLLYLADARGVTAGTMIALLIMFYMRVRPSPVKTLVGSMIATAGIAAFFILVWLFDWRNLTAAIIGEDVFSLDGRIALWSFALKTAAQSPIIGVGYYNSRTVLLPEFPFAGHSHNSFIEVFLCTGTIGLVISLAFVVLCIHAAISQRDRLLVGVLVALSMEILLNPGLFTPSFAMYLITVSGIDAFARTEMAQAFTAARAKPAPVPVWKLPRYAGETGTPGRPSPR